jgi:hypothetical protein
MSSNASSARMPPARMTTPQTPSEETNISLVKEYMRIAYSPTENHGRQSVAHLCLDDAWFWAPTTFPGVESPQEYAESHSQVMASIADLHIVCYDQVFAKDGHVLLRYTAEGSHCGEPHDGIEKSGKKAKCKLEEAMEFLLCEFLRWC